MSPTPPSPAVQPGNVLFPIFVKLEKFAVLIVGGGAVGLEKLTALLRNSPGARITLVGATIRPEIRALAAPYPHVLLREKAFEPSDLDGQQFVLAATDNRALNSSIRRLATGAGILTNVADTPDECDFYLGSIVQKGDLKIAISTNGKSPTVAKRLREVLDEALPTELDTLLQRLPAIRARLAGDFAAKVRALNELTATLAPGSERPSGSELSDDLAAIFRRRDIEKISGRRWRRIATAALTAFGLLLIFNVVSFYVPPGSWPGLVSHVDPSFWLFVGTGFLAQLIDGLLGMGYGVTTQIVLMNTGVPLAAISSSIHTAEVFASGASGYTHYRFGNVNRRLFRALLWPGVAGAILGAALLAWLGAAYAAWVRPVLAVYTLLLGARILLRAFRPAQPRRKVRGLGYLAGAGGFFDSFGGGGWGPLVASTLLARGKTPRFVIGTVSLTEFFITLASALTFFSLIGVSHWPVIAGLILGGVLAAPFSARLAGKLPVKFMFAAVGIMVIFWSLRILVQIIY